MLEFASMLTAVKQVQYDVSEFEPNFQNENDKSQVNQTNVLDQAFIEGACDDNTSFNLNEALRATEND